MQIEVGMVLSGRVTGVTSFGAFVELPDGKSGLIHISEIAEEFVQNVGDHLKMGQNIKVKVIGIENNKVSLSVKQLNAEDIEKAKQVRAQKKKRTVQPRNNQPPEEFEFVVKKEHSEMSFDDMLQKFKHDSDEKFQALKRSNDGKRSGGYKRSY